MSIGAVKAADQLLNHRLSNHELLIDNSLKSHTKNHTSGLLEHADTVLTLETTFLNRGTSRNNEDMRQASNQRVGLLRQVIAAPFYKASCLLNNAYTSVINTNEILSVCAPSFPVCAKHILTFAQYVLLVQIVMANIIAKTIDPVSEPLD